MSRGELDALGGQQIEERIVRGRSGTMDRVEHALVLLRAGHGENVRVALGDRFWLGPHAPGHDDLAVLRQRLTDGPQRLLLGAVEKAAGIDDHQIGTVVLGREFVAFRLHLPSEITSQNTSDRRRGNILVWEQRLAERLMGAPLTIEARMETQSILYRTLWLFGATFLAVAVAFALIIVWVLKRGGVPPDAARLETPPG